MASLTGANLLDMGLAVVVPVPVSWASTDNDNTMPAATATAPSTRLRSIIAFLLACLFLDGNRCADALHSLDYLRAAHSGIRAWGGEGNAHRSCSNLGKR